MLVSIDNIRDQRLELSLMQRLNIPFTGEALQ